ncbi:hypothetical protein U1Q18_025207, partial [Sarracenia purpurea var. burkii]
MRNVDAYDNEVLKGGTVEGDDAKQEEGEDVLDTFILSANEGERVLMVDRAKECVSCVWVEFLQGLASVSDACVCGSSVLPLNLFAVYALNPIWKCYFCYHGAVIIAVSSSHSLDDVHCFVNT